MGPIEISLAALSITIAGTGAGLALANYKLAAKKHEDDLALAQKKREDDLFDRRYALYEEITTLWAYYLRLPGRDLVPPKEDSPLPLSTYEMGSLILKTGFLFDEKIKDAVAKLVSKVLDIFEPDSEAASDTMKEFPLELFEKYLNVK